MFDKIIAFYADGEYNMNRTNVWLVRIGIEECGGRMRTSVSSETPPH